MRIPNNQDLIYKGLIKCKFKFTPTRICMNTKLIKVIEKEISDLDCEIHALFHLPITIDDTIQDNYIKFINNIVNKSIFYDLKHERNKYNNTNNK